MLDPVRILYEIHLLCVHDKNDSNSQWQFLVVNTGNSHVTDISWKITHCEYLFILR